VGFLSAGLEDISWETLHALLAGKEAVACFGTNALGRQPAVTADAPYPTPALVPGVTNIASISLGSEHVLALTRTGTVMSWGDQRVGERGHPGMRPAPISGLTTATSILNTAP
jgi:alpha-tubulin suppressor-like RCC1 family protein